MKEEVEFEDLLRKKSCTAIWILVSGILLGIVIVILFNETAGIYGIFSSLILSFLAFAFSYYQFFLNKIDTERREKENHKQNEIRRSEDHKQNEIRRLNNLKLIIYKDISKGCYDLFSGCSELLISRTDGLNHKTNELDFLANNLLRKADSFQKNAKLSYKLLNINLTTPQSYTNFSDIMKSIIIKKNFSEEECCRILQQFELTKEKFNEYLLETLISPNPEN